MPLLRVSAPLASLFFLSGFAIAQIYAPDCSTTWEWTFNSLGQNACTVAAYMMSTCSGGSFTINALPGPGYYYTGPSGSDDGDLCKCNTVAYSLLSACDACQGSDWITWAEYNINCTSVMPPVRFPNPVPSGTRVPYWAYIDITVEGTWDANEAEVVGDLPEGSPGFYNGLSSTSPVASQTSTSLAVIQTPSSNASPTGVPVVTPSASGSSKSKSDTPAIAGGVAGSIVAVSVALAVLYFYLRRRRPQVLPAVSAGVGASQPHMDETPVSLSGKGTDEPSSLSWSPMRLYDPDDPTTFPGYQGNPHSLDIPSQITMSSSTGIGYAPSTQTSPSLARGFHGLPTV